MRVTISSDPESCRTTSQVRMPTRKPPVRPTTVPIHPIWVTSLPHATEARTTFSPCWPDTRSHRREFSCATASTLIRTSPAEPLVWLRLSTTKWVFAIILLLNHITFSNHIIILLCADAWIRRRNTRIGGPDRQGCGYLPAVDVRAGVRRPQAHDDQGAGNFCVAHLFVVLRKASQVVRDEVAQDRLQPQEVRWTAGFYSVPACGVRESLPCSISTHTIYSIRVQYKLYTVCTNQNAVVAQRGDDQDHPSSDEAIQHQQQQEQPQYIHNLPSYSQLTEK